MKKIISNLAISIFVLLGVGFGLSGCYETHYYHQYNHHTRGWYEHRHRTPPANVNFEVDIETRRHRH
ncbi:hypothetical protein [Ferruginibacter sp.]